MESVLISESSNPPKTSKSGLIVSGILGGTAIALSAICLPFVSPGFRRICLPYVPATTEQVKNVLEALKGRSGTLIDLGSGDGRIVLEAAKAGFPSAGVELNLWLVLFSKLEAFRHNTKNAEFYRKDLWKFSLKPYKNVVIFGVSEMMADLDLKFQRELESDCCIVACRFPIPGRTPVKTIGAGIDTVWLYKT